MKKNLSYLIITFLIAFVVGINETKALVKKSELVDGNISDGICDYTIRKEIGENKLQLKMNVKIYVDENTVKITYGSNNLEYDQLEYTEYSEKYVTSIIKEKRKCIDFYYSTRSGEHELFSTQKQAVDFFNGYRCYYCLVDGLSTQNYYIWTKQKTEKCYEKKEVIDEEECNKIIEEYEASKNQKEESTASIVSCGNGMLNNIPGRLPKITNTIVNVIKIAIPIAIIIFGMIDLAKGVVSQKDDEIKKGQKTFFTRLLTGVIVFFVIFIVQIVIRFVAEDSKNVLSCVDCFINNNCDE